MCQSMIYKQICISLKAIRTKENKTVIKETTKQISMRCVNAKFTAHYVSEKNVAKCQYARRLTSEKYTYAGIGEKKSISDKNKKKKGFW